MIAVLGVGGVGGLVAARTGALCVGTERSVAAIRERGLRLDCEEASSVVRLEAVEHLDRPVSLLVVAVKAPALGDALRRVGVGHVERAVVLPLLNGLEHLEPIRARLPGVTVVAGSIGRLEVFSPEPGLVVQPRAGAVIEVASDVLPPDSLADAVAPLVVPGIEVVVGSSERATLWRKAARMAVLAAATTASGLAVGDLRSSAVWRRRLEAALFECCAAAAADGVTVDPAAELATIDALPGELTTSAARDAAAGRPSELDAITGSVARAARRHGVPAPELERLLRDASAVEARR